MLSLFEQSLYCTPKRFFLRNLEVLKTYDCNSTLMLFNLQFHLPTPLVTTLKNICNYIRCCKTILNSTEYMKILFYLKLSIVFKLLSKNLKFLKSLKLPFLIINTQINVCQCIQKSSKSNSFIMKFSIVEVFGQTSEGTKTCNEICKQ